MAVNYSAKTYVQVGQRVLIECPYSEVCIHMRLAGRLMYAEVLRSEGGYCSVQLYDGEGPFGRVHSFPIGLGEAGFYQEKPVAYPHDRIGVLDRVYYYPPVCQEDASQFGPLPDRATT